METSSNTIAFVPCEICDEPIAFDQYMQHVEQCSLQNSRLQLQNTYNHIQQRTALMVRDDEDGRVYRVFIDDALRAFHALQSNILNPTTQNDANNQVGNNTFARNNETSTDSDIDSAHEDDPRDEEGYIRTPQTHRSVVIIPRIIVGPFENVQNDGYEFNMLLSESLGKVEIGMTDYTKALKPIENIDLKSEICPICYDNNVDTQTICNHVYCTSCISKWLKTNKTCPICKTDLDGYVEKLISTCNNINS
jgi:hypothetical protein